MLRIKYGAFIIQRKTGFTLIGMLESCRKFLPMQLQYMFNITRISLNFCCECFCPLFNGRSSELFVDREK
ncbi:unnamed protein product [Caenorhabditis brenneri]